MALFIPNKKTKFYEEKYILARKIQQGLDVCVEKGDKVKRDTILASGEFLEEKKRLDLSGELGIKPFEVKRSLFCLNGEMVKKGDIVAKMYTKIVRKEKRINAPTTGVISLDEINLGFLKILGISKESAVQSGVEGIVTSAIKNKNISIETHVLKLKPFLILGKSVQGEIYHVTKRQNIGPNLADSILLCNFNVDAAYLRELALNRVAGIIVPGIDTLLVERLKLERLWGLSIVIMEGYGELNLDTDTLELLKMNDGFLSIMDTKEQEIVLTNFRKDDLKKDESTLASLNTKNRVQISSFDSWGAFGAVEKIRDQVAEVALESSNKKVKVHISNLIRL